MKLHICYEMILPQMMRLELSVPSILSGGTFIILLGVKEIWVPALPEPALKAISAFFLGKRRLQRIPLSLHQVSLNTMTVHTVNLYKTSITLTLPSRIVQFVIEFASYTSLTRMWLPEKNWSRTMPYLKRGKYIWTSIKVMPSWSLNPAKDERDCIFKLQLQVCHNGRFAFQLARKKKTQKSF